MRADLTSIVLLLLLSASSYAQSARPSYTATRVSIPPTVDGNLSDAAWQGVAEISGFTQTQPDDGKPARSRTRAKIVYDDEAIYVAAVMEDDHPVTPLLTRRDSDLSRGDLIRVAIDSQHDGLTAFSFLVNPSNVQRDFVFFNDGFISPAWNGVWDSATAITSAGWQAELRIPLSQLRFSSAREQTWGFNISRWNVRLKEFSHFAHAPRTESAVVSRFATLTGIRDIRRPRYLELLPYAVARSDLRSGPASPLSESQQDRLYGGLDLKLGITRSLTLTATLNPDFGQVEVDPSVINLTQFETFFPEYRPFFSESASMFEFDQGPAANRWSLESRFPLVFYSRRIGRAPQRQLTAEHADVPPETTILGALKLTGRTPGGWSIGLLDALTAEESGRFTHRSDIVNRQVVEPMTNYFAARLLREFARARVGAMVTATHRGLSEETRDAFRETAYFLGTDGYLWSARREWLTEWQLGGSLVEGSPSAMMQTQKSPARYYQRPDAQHLRLDSRRGSLAGYMSRATLSREAGRWRPNVQVQLFSPGLEINDLGFLPRVDRIYSHALIYYRNAQPTSRRREMNGWAGKYQSWNFGGDMVSNGVAGGWGVQMRSYRWVESWMGWRGSVLDDQATRGGASLRKPGQHYAGFSAGSDPQRGRSASVSLEVLRSDDGGSQETLSASLTLQPTQAVILGLQPRVIRAVDKTHFISSKANPLFVETYGIQSTFASLDQRQVELGLRGQWTLSPALSFQIYLQPLLASGRYAEFKSLARAASDRFVPVNAPFDPDFTRSALQGSAVARWEFRRGSTLFVAWNEQRNGTSIQGDLRAGRDLACSPPPPRATSS